MAQRISEYPINKIFTDRWSARAISDELLTDEQILPLFEAAKWAPSSYNAQPWRFIYAKRGTRFWEKLFDLMVPFNQSWAKNAPVLVLVISRTIYEWNQEPAQTYSFDTGAACENLALQGSINGLVVHAVEGFDYAKARTVFAIPQEYVIQAMFIIGKPGRKEDLPQDLQEREVPSDRKKLSEIVFENVFKPS